MLKREKSPTPPSEGSALLIVGLGNPGSSYAKTRHNAGFLALDSIAANHDLGQFKQRPGLEAEVLEANLNGRKVILAKPTTFMNLSGRSVQKLLNHFHLASEQLTVLYDDLTLDVGAFEIRTKPSSGSHNGIKSIQGALPGAVFTRVRIGIGATPDHYKQSDWVLSAFSKQELESVKESAQTIADEIL